METELAGLAASAATTIVDLLATDAWAQVKERIGTLWWRFSSEQAGAVEAALESERLEIVNADAPVALAIIRDWESRFLRLAASNDAVADELRRIVADLRKIPAEESARGTAHQQAKNIYRSTVIQVGRDLSLGEVSKFCSHGNPAEFRCQICTVPVCWECDVIEWRNRYRKGSYGSEPCVTLSAEGFGYLRKVYCFTDEWTITGARIIKTETSPGRVIGPFLHINDIMPQLTSLAGNELRHVCCDCVSRALPAAAAAIYSGHICERPGCGAMTDSRCRCCCGAFCREHVGPNEAESMPSMRMSGLFTPRLIVTIGWGERGHCMVPPENLAFRGIRPFGLCEMCALERASEAELEIIVICDNHPGLLRVEPSDVQGGHESRFAYKIRTRKMPAAFLQQAENKRARAIAYQCGTTISDKVAMLERLYSECRRSQFFANFKSAPLGRSRAEQELAMTTVKYVEWYDYLAGRGLSPFVYVTNDEDCPIGATST